MTTTTPTLDLVLYNSSTDQSVLFSAYIDQISGTAVTSNFYRIDTAIADIIDDITILLGSRGSVRVSAMYSAPNTYTASVAGYTSYTSGDTIVLSVNTTTTTTATLNINGLGAKSLMKVNSSGTPIDLTTSDLGKGGFYLFSYDGTRWLWVSANSADQIHIVGTAGNLVTVNSDKTLLGTTTQASMLAGTTNSASAKSPPVDNDEIPIADSAATYGLKKVLWSVVKSTLKTYNDGLYAALAGLSSQVFSVGSATAVAHAVRADQIQTQSLQAYTTTGTSVSYVLGTLGTPIALTTGERWHLKFHTTSLIFPFMTRDAKESKDLTYYTGDGTKVGCTSRQIISNLQSDVVYDGGNYVVLHPAGQIDGAASSTDGNVTLWSGTTGRILKDDGVTFVGKTAWTPVILGSTGGTPESASYSLQAGQYMRIGNACFFVMDMTYSGYDGTGATRITGLPYTAATGMNSPIYTSWTNVALPDPDSKLIGYVLSGTDYISLYSIVSGAAAALAVDAAASFRIAGTYYI